MELKINQVIYHILDTGASQPLLSDRPMEPDADLFDYFDTCLQKAFAADDGKNCAFLPDSAFKQELDSNGDFVDLSRRIAGVIFDHMLMYPSIPAGDLAVVDFTAAGVPYLGVLKLCYKPGYTHKTNTLGNARYSTMTPQYTLLPGTPKAEEAALIDKANGGLRLIEKKYEQNGKKEVYLSTKIFGCTQAMQEKAKLKAVCQTAAEAVRQAYPDPGELEDVPPFEGGTETAVELMVRNQAVENTIAVEDVCARMQELYPDAAPAFEAALEEAGVEKRDTVTVSPARMRRMESRSFKTERGIEIKIPAELCNSDEAVEFIHTATGGLSLLIKDVVL